MWTKGIILSPFVHVSFRWACSPVVPPRTCLTHRNAGDAGKRHPPPDSHTGGMACHPFRTDHEDADENEDPSECSEGFPSSGGSLDELNGRPRGHAPSQRIGAVRARCRLVGDGMSTLGACDEARNFLRCRSEGYSSPSWRPSRISFTASRALNAMAARGAVSTRRSCASSRGSKR